MQFKDVNFGLKMSSWKKYDDFLKKKKKEDEYKL